VESSNPETKKKCIEGFRKIIKQPRFRRIFLIRLFERKQEEWGEGIRGGSPSENPPRRRRFLVRWERKHTKRIPRKELRLVPPGGDFSPNLILSCYEAQMREEQHPGKKGSGEKERKNLDMRSLWFLQHNNITIKRMGGRGHTRNIKEEKPPKMLESRGTHALKYRFPLRAKEAQGGRIGEVVSIFLVPETTACERRHRYGTQRGKETQGT